MHNFLKNETSPYLLQHAENPVNWYPWCKEAFERAKREDKPVFLSIGYSTCHWCHVMAHESFEDEETAEKLGKAVGRYITIEIPELTFLSSDLPKIVETVKESLDLLLPQQNGLVLVAGVGNSDITADALGPFVASKILSTRHLSEELQRSIGFKELLRPVSAISTGVLGQTGLESSEYIKCIVNEINPCCVITVDALLLVV